jgi:hypothetical protein
MGVSVKQTASADSCYLTTGGAEIGSINNTYIVDFEGELCLPTSFTYVLRGTVNIIPVNTCPVNNSAYAPLMVSAGELIVYGGVHTSGPVPTATPGGTNPIPVSLPAGGGGSGGGAIISIIGSTGQIPAPCPSP